MESPIKLLRPKMNSSTFYVATWVIHHGDLQTETRIFHDLAPIADFFVKGFRILACSDEDTYNDGKIEIPLEVQKYKGGKFQFEYSDMTFCIVETTQEEFMKTVFEKLPSIGHILYMGYDV